VLGRSDERLGKRLTRDPYCFSAQFENTTGREQRTVNPLLLSSSRFYTLPPALHLMLLMQIASL
jgi:hypothetical protein